MASSQPWTNLPAQAQAGSPSEQDERLVDSNPRNPAAPEIQPIAPRVRLTGFQHEWQTWNNCGPATMSMNLSYYDHVGTQVEAAQFLKPNPEDKNVSPDELVDYVRSSGFEAVVGHGGDITLLKHLLSNRLPVVVELWIEPEDHGGIGHYRLLTGYSEAEDWFWAYDSLHGPRITVRVDELDDFWRVFNRTYVVAFPSERADLVYTILGSRVDTTVMHEDALRIAQGEIEATPEDAFAWFNVGTNYARLGEPALAAYGFDEARRLGLPYRTLWYQFDLFETYLAIGRYQEVIELTTITLKSTGGLEELYYYRGLARKALNQPEAAAQDFRAALDHNPNYDPAAQALEDIES